MLLLIDNYDSFTYNLVHYLGELGADIVVKRNDALDVQAVMAMKPSSIVLSPGPCDPAAAGICLPLTLAAHEALHSEEGVGGVRLRRGSRLRAHQHRAILRTMHMRTHTHTRPC